MLDYRAKISFRPMIGETLTIRITIPGFQPHRYDLLWSSDVGKLHDDIATRTLPQPAFPPLVHIDRRAP